MDYKWKYLIRKGVPMIYMRPLLLDLFRRTYENNELDYESSLKVVLGEKVRNSFKNVPLFIN